MPQGDDIELTGAEFDLLRTFLERPGRVLSRDQLLDLTRGREGDVLDRSIDVLVSRLRRKLADGGAPQLFKTVRNGGYQLAAQGGRRGRRAMNTLRVKIALLMVVAIVTVVGLADRRAVLSAWRRLKRVAFARCRWRSRSRCWCAWSTRAAVPLPIVPQPVARAQSAEGVDREAARCARRARARSCRHGVARRLARAAGRLDPGGDTGWVLMPIADLPPPGAPWRGLIRWLLLITIGRHGDRGVRRQSHGAGRWRYWKTRSASIGPDGALPTLPERGPAEVRATAKALNSLSSRLKRAMESRMRLVAAAGHDLRTPITRMRLRAEFVEDDEERARWLTDLDELERIADSAILLVREESGKAPPELIQLDELVGSIGAELRDQKLDVTETDARAGQGAREPAHAQPRAAQPHHQCRDAWRQSQGRGRRLERGGAYRHRGRWAGIPPDLLDQVFEPFFRADPARRQDIRGAGLGLTIAREIIQRAGGTISIANRESGGLRQVVELPKAAEAPV